MNVAFAMTCGYLLITVAVTIVFAVRSKSAKASSKKFLTAESELKWYFVAPLLFAEMMAGAATIGKASTGYSTGIVGVWVNWGMAIGMILFIIFVARFYRAMKRKYHILSVPEAFKCVFDTKCRMVVLAIVIVAYCYLYSSQPISAAAIIGPMLHIDNTLAITWIISALFIIVTLLGGMKGLAIINIIHMTVMYSGLIWLASGSVELAGGTAALFERLPDSYWSLMGTDAEGTIANALATALSYLTCAPMVAAVIGARSAKDMTKGTWIAALVIFPFAVLPAIVGMAAAVAAPGIAPNTAFYTMANMLGSIPAGYGSMAIMAALWSSAPAALLFIATVVTQDFFCVFKRGVTEKQKKLFAKLTIVVFGIVATILGLCASSILGQLYAAFQIRSVASIVLLAVIFWRKTTANASFWAMVSGGVVAAVWSTSGGLLGISGLWPAIVVTLAVLVTWSLVESCGKPMSEPHRISSEAISELLAEERVGKNLR